MQQGDQTVLSLRPGGGRGNRLFGSSSSSSSLSFGSLSSSDLPLLRPHGGAPASYFPFKVPSFLGAKLPSLYLDLALLVPRILKFSVWIWFC